MFLCFASVCFTRSIYIYTYMWSQLKSIYTWHLWRTFFNKKYSSPNYQCKINLLKMSFPLSSVWKTLVKYIWIQNNFFWMHKSFSTTTVRLWGVFLHEEYLLHKATFVRKSYDEKKVSYIPTWDGRCMHKKSDFATTFFKYFILWGILRFCN